MSLALRTLVAPCVRVFASVELLCGFDIDRAVPENRTQGLRPLIRHYACPRPRPVEIQLLHRDILKIDRGLTENDAVAIDLEKLPSLCLTKFVRRL